MHDKRWLFALVLGLVCALGIGVGIHFYTNRKQQFDLVAHAAHNAGLDVPTFKRLMDIFNQANLTHKLSDSDWQFIEKEFYTGKPNAVDMTIPVLWMAAIPSNRYDEIKRMALQYVQTHPTNPICPFAIGVLWRYHLPEWQFYAREYLHQAPPQNAQVAEGLFKQWGLLKQIQRGDTAP